MATTDSKKPKDIDITKTGPMNWSQLQSINNASDEYLSQDFLDFMNSLGNSVSQYDARLHAQQDVASPFMQQKTRTGDQDYWGNSWFDNATATQEEFENLADIRAENQPWYSKLVNGVGKAGVLAATTALETAGLLYGVGQGAYNAANAEEGEGGKAFLHGLWDNPITKALQKVTEYSEEYMPNYYSRDEQENPWSNIFTANFLGDKLIKNFGFMVGAFYGGLPASNLIGKVGTNAVKNARNAALARNMGNAKRLSELTAEYSDDVLGKVGAYGREIRGLSDGAASIISRKYGDEVVGAYKKLVSEGLTEGERGKVFLEGLEKINSAASTTRAVSQTLGALGSAINEGAIEAINNSKDWAEMQAMEARDRYQKDIADIDRSLGDSTAGIEAKLERAKELEKELAEIERGRASMGNADLLLNIPVLMASNMYQLGRLYTRGFDSSRRQMGSLLNGHRLSGELAKGTLKTDKTGTKAIISALLKSNTEGSEEYLQRAASDGAGRAVEEAIDRYMDAGTSERSKVEVDDYIAGFGKAIADNLNDPNAWEEYFIGAVSSMVGMPVFGSQTKNAYGPMKDNGIFGFAGGVVGEYQNYMDARAKEKGVAEYLNNRVKQKEFKDLYEHLRKYNDYEVLLEDALLEKDKRRYADLKFELLFEDIDAAASSGHLEEFKELVNFNTDYTDAELKDIVKTTTTTVSADQQRSQDELIHSLLAQKILKLKEAESDGALTASMARDLEEYQKEAKEIEQRIDANDYHEKNVGPFVDVNGQMDTFDPDKMREVLERNRLTLLENIDNYLKVRNDIDIETDGRLNREQISFLTMLKTKILNLDSRSAEMAYDLIETLRSNTEGENSTIVDNFKKFKTLREKELEAAEDSYSKAAAALKEAEDNGEKKDVIEAKKKKEQEAKDRVTNVKKEINGINNAIEIIDFLTKDREATDSESKAFVEGYGKPLEATRNRRINADELQKLLSIEGNVRALNMFVGNRISNLDLHTRNRLYREIEDLHTIALEKHKYREKLREYLGVPERINDAYKERDDKISKKELESKSDELASRIKGVKSMQELDNVLNEARQISNAITEEAIKKAKKDGSEDFKKLMDDYEEGFKFYVDFMNQVRTLSEGRLAEAIIPTAEDSWERAIAEGINSKQVFVEHMQRVINDEEYAKNNKDVIEAIKGILADFDIIASTTATKKGANKQDNPRTPEEKESSAERRARTINNATEGVARRKKDDTPEEDTRKILEKAIKDEILASKSVDDDDYAINSWDGLSKELQERIEKFNKAQENKTDEIPKSIVFSILNSILDEDIRKLNVVQANISKSNDEEAEEVRYSGTPNERASQMKGDLRVSFKNDHFPEFNVNATDHKVSSYPSENPEATEAIKAKLKELKAYDFMDRNYLGYLMQELKDDGGIEVFFLRSTDEKIDDPRNSSKAPIFVAIELSPERENIIKEKAFNNSKGIKPAINVQTINGVNYQILGVVTFNQSDKDKAVEIAFGAFHSSVVSELKESVREEARAKGQPFVVSTKKSFVKNIYTGRLEKKNDENDVVSPERKVSLFTFMTDKQGETSEQHHDRALSTEWAFGMNFHFGVVVNQLLNVSSALRPDLLEDVNSEWAEKNNGAILLYVPRPDGKYYPLRCTRRTVGKWLKSSDNAAQKEGEKLIAELAKDSSVEGFEYLTNIIGYLKNLFDKDASPGKKMEAKRMLSRYFIFGNVSPIHFDDFGINLRFEDDPNTDIRVENEDGDGNRSFETFVSSFFDILGKHNIMFTLPTNSIERINGRDVINSGVFEIGLRGFYNYNSNFTIVPIDGNGEPVVIKNDNAAPVQSLGAGNVRDNIWELTINGVKGNYVIHGDGTATHEDRSKVTDDEQNQISLLIKARDGKLRTVKADVIDNGAYSDTAKDLLNNKLGSRFDDIFLTDDGDFLCIFEHQNHACKVVSINSQEAKDKMEEIKETIRKITAEDAFKIAVMKAKKEASATPSETKGAPEAKAPKPKPSEPKAPEGPANDAPKDSKTGRFAGKELHILNIADYDPVNSIEALLINHRDDKDGFAHGVFAGLQQLESEGVLDDKLLEDVKKSLSSFYKTFAPKERKKYKNEIMQLLGACRKK